MDQYWKAALMAALDLLPFVDAIYAPNKFFPFSRKFLPLEFSLLRKSMKVGFCVQKDLLHCLDPGLLEAVSTPEQVVYSNEVFVVGCTTPPQEVRWIYHENDMHREYLRLRDAALSGLSGRNSTSFWRIDRGTSDYKVLVVGATGMGNIGDDLIAMSLGGHIRSAIPGCSIYFSDFRISRSDLEDFDLIVVGGGGIVYVSQFGDNDSDNLANYFKIPLWARELSIPCLILGVGVQGRADQFSRNPIASEFLGTSIEAATSIVVRDQLSRSILAPLTENQITVLPDPVFSYADQLPHFQSAYDQGGLHSIAFIGEIFAERLSFFNQPLRNYGDSIIRLLEGHDIRYFVMSNDDLSHADRVLSFFASKNVECRVHDLRTSSPQDLLHLFHGMSGIVTTRFHGLVLSIIAGCPALSIDLSSGKHSRLIADYLPSMRRNVIDETLDSEGVVERLVTLVEEPSCLLPSSVEVRGIANETRRYTKIIVQQCKR